MFWDLYLPNHQRVNDHSLNSGEHPGDHNHQDFLKSTVIQMGGVLHYKWEAYCDTMGGSTDSTSLSLEPRGPKYCNTNGRLIAIQMGGVLRYFFREVVVVGVSRHSSEIGYGLSRSRTPLTPFFDTTSSRPRSGASDWSFSVAPGELAYYSWLRTQ